MRKSHRVALVAAALGSLSAFGSDRCIAPREFVAYPKGTPGIYDRVSPDGNFIIQSLSGEEFGDVSIVDIRRDRATGRRVARIVKTPMNNETYPVEGPWRLIASPNHMFKGMKYFRFEDLLRQKENAAELFSDGFSEFYHTCAELPGSTPERIKFRTMSWTKLLFRDFDVELNPDGSLKGEVKRKKDTWLCLNIYTDEGFELVQPILSKDGTELAGIPQNSHNPTMRIYKILNSKGDCERVDDLGFQTSKVSFSHPIAGKKGKVAFTNTDNVFVYDRDEGVTFPIGDLPREKGFNYPGMTKDGRVIYLVNREGRMGYSIIDPYQSRPTAEKKCITEAEVAAVEERQAAIWKLPGSMGGSDSQKP